MSNFAYAWNLGITQTEFNYLMGASGLLCAFLVSFFIINSVNKL